MRGPPGFVVSVCLEFFFHVLSVLRVPMFFSVFVSLTSLLEVLRVPLYLYVSLCVCVYFYVFLCVSMYFYVFLVFCGYPLILHVFLCIQWKIFYVHIICGSPLHVLFLTLFLGGHWPTRFFLFLGLFCFWCKIFSGDFFSGNLGWVDRARVGLTVTGV